MGTTRVTELLARCLMMSAALFLPAGSQSLNALNAQNFNGLSPSIPSFVFYRDSQPQTPQNLIFSPINTPYRQYIVNTKLTDKVLPPPFPGPVKIGVINSRAAPLKQNVYDVRENNGFETLNSNEYALPPKYGDLATAINNPRFIGQRNNGFAIPSGRNLASSSGFLHSIPQSSSPPSQQVSLLRYANSFPQPAGEQDDLVKALRSLSQTLHQRQRSVASAGELVYRQQKAGAKPFLSASSEGVHREGGEELTSLGGFLGQRHRGPTFVSAVGTPVSGVGQNPLYTGDSVQASKLDEASDVRGVKSPGGIPAPGRLPVSQDAYFARPFPRYASNFGYSMREDPIFFSMGPTLVSGRGPFILPPEAYRRGVINR